MGRLDRYILAQLLWVFGFFSLVLVSVYWVNRAVRLFDQLISDGQSMGVFLEFTALSLPMMIRSVLPIAAFVSATYVTVRLMRDSEIAVMQAAGLSPLRLARPVVIFGLIVSLFLTVLMNVIIPEARTRLSQRQSEVAQNITAGLLQDGVFQHPAEGVTFFIAEITPEGVMRGIYLSDARSAARRVDYSARTALIVPEQSGPKLVMIDGQAQIYNAESGLLSITGFDDFTYDLSSMIGPGGDARTVQEMSTLELIEADPRQLTEAGATLAMFRFELFSRFIDGFTALSAALIGFAALMAGGFSRLGIWREIVLAVALIAVVQALTNAIASPAMRSTALSWLGLVPIGFALGAALVLLLWAARNSRRHRRRPRLPQGDTA